MEERNFYLHSLLFISYSATSSKFRGIPRTMHHCILQIPLQSVFYLIIRVTDLLSHDRIRVTDLLSHDRIRVTDLLSHDRT